MWELVDFHPPPCPPSPLTCITSRCLFTCCFLSSVSLLHGHPRLQEREEHTVMQKHTHAHGTYCLPFLLFLSIYYLYIHTTPPPMQTYIWNDELKPALTLLVAIITLYWQCVFICTCVGGEEGVQRVGEKIEAIRPPQHFSADSRCVFSCVAKLFGISHENTVNLLSALFPPYFLSAHTNTPLLDLLGHLIFMRVSRIRTLCFGFVCFLRFVLFFCDWIWWNCSLFHYNLFSASLSPKFRGRGWWSF